MINLKSMVKTFREVNQFNLIPPKTTLKGFYFLGAPYTGSNRIFKYTCVGKPFWYNDNSYKEIRWKKFRFHFQSEYKFKVLNEINKSKEVKVRVQAISYKDRSTIKDYSLEEYQKYEYLVKELFPKKKYMIFIGVYSIIDESFIGTPDKFLTLQERGICSIQKSKKKNNVASIGFNPEEQKWYGWSHRAIYGFGIGSTAKKGDLIYKDKEWTAKTLEDARKMAVYFAEGIS